MINLLRILVETDDVRTLRFASSEDCSGEILIAELYSSTVTDMEDITLLYTISSGSDTGDEKGSILEMSLDFDGVDSGAYFCKIYTDETGVLARAVAVVQ